MVKNVIRIAQVKTTPAKAEIEANHQLLMSVLDSLAPHQPDVVVTPECFLDGYVSTLDAVTRENIVRYAIEPGTSRFVDDVARWAAANRSWVILGCTRLASGGAHNSAFIFSRAGQLAGTYDKVHLQQHDCKYLPGGNLPVFQSDFGPFGVMICADRRWPETVRTLALKGARVIFNPTYGMHDDRNLRMMQTRSYESEVFIAFTHPAQALVTGPAGQIINNEVSADSPWAVCQVDLAEADAVRASPGSHLKDRRPDVYDA